MKCTDDECSGELIVTTHVTFKITTALMLELVALDPYEYLEVACDTCGMEPPTPVLENIDAIILVGADINTIETNMKEAVNGPSRRRSGS
jgi:hypothetical protein